MHKEDILKWRDCAQGGHYKREGSCREGNIKARDGAGGQYRRQG